MTLRVTTPTSFGPEREYALSVVLGEFLGLDYRHETEPREDVRISMNGGGELRVADGLFSLPSDEWLPSRPLEKWDVRRDLPEAVVSEPLLHVLFGGGRMDSQRLGLDVFGGAFFMLTRYEEAISSERDEHGRFPAKASLAVAEGFLHRPLVNEYAEVLWAALRRIWPRLERRERNFRVVPTHDVDVPLSLRRPGPRGVLTAAADLARRRDPQLAAQRLRWLARGSRDDDPTATFDTLMELSERRGLRSAFYFLAGGTNGHDASYSLDDPWFRRLLRRIDERGHEIGFHGSYETFRDPELTRAELQALQRACADEGIASATRGGRQHYLRFENPTTWQIWADAGLAYDSTLGFGDRPGFRCGTCFEYPVFNVRTRQRLPLRERPLVVMERGGLAEGFETIARLKAECRRYGGDFVLLWHNDWAVGRRGREGYERALDC
jgi:hypothetical protein